MMEYASWWKHVALAQNPGNTLTIPKPVGVFPGSAQQDAAGNVTLGDGTSWWLNPGFGAGAQYFPLPKGKQFHGDMYSLLLWAYRQTVASGNPDTSFLTPIYEAAILVDAFGGNSGAAPGTPEWAAHEMRRTIGNALADAKEDLEASSIPVNLTILTDVIRNNADAYRIYRSINNNNTDKLTQVFEHATDWLRSYWPLGTSAVLYTDRAFLFSETQGLGSSHHILYSSMTGGPYSPVPSSPITWFAEAGTTLDFAALVHEHRSDRLDVLLYNFGDAADVFGLRYWRGLQPGTYDVIIAPDDSFDSNTPPTGTLEVPQQGSTSLSFTLPQGTLYRLSLQLDTPSTSGSGPTADAAMSVEDFVFHPTGDIDLRIHNLGTTQATVTVNNFGAGTAQVLPPPQQLTPSSLTVTTSGWPGGYPLTVSLTTAEGDFNSENDEVTIYPPMSLSKTSGTTAYDLSLIHI